uniref:Uncharacterized protein n=1 Tax=Sphaerodactylus townsendi TaxID=933632 RepID=A0ACB8G0K6_9SAUR
MEIQDQGAQMEPLLPTVKAMRRSGEPLPQSRQGGGGKAGGKHAPCRAARGCYVVAPLERCGTGVVAPQRAPICSPPHPPCGAGQRWCGQSAAGARCSFHARLPLAHRRSVGDSASQRLEPSLSHPGTQEAYSGVGLALPLHPDCPFRAFVAVLGTHTHAAGEMHSLSAPREYEKAIECAPSFKRIETYPLS